MFLTIADETGDAQLILWPQVFHPKRSQLGSHVLLAQGVISAGTARPASSPPKCAASPRVPMLAAHDCH